MHQKLKHSEKTLRKYKKNAEKKFIAQNEIHSQELKKKDKDKKKSLNDQEDENREIHKYMNKLLNEKISEANKIIDNIRNDPEYMKKIDNKKKKKRTNKKKKKRKKRTKRKWKGIIDFVFLKFF